MLMKIAIEQFINYMETVGKSRATVSAYTRCMNHLNYFLSLKNNGPVYIQEVCFADLEGYLNLLKKKGLKPSSRNWTTYIIRSFYKFLVKREVVLKNISLQLEYIPEEEIERVYLFGRS